MRDVATSADHVCATFQLENGTVHFFDWICEQCSPCYLSDLHLQDQLATDMHSSDPMTAQKSQLLLRTLETLKMDGVVLTKDVMKEYKQILNNLDLPCDRHNQLCNSFRKYLSILSKNHNYSRYQC